MSDRSRRELEERIDELEATLEELRAELGPRRGPVGLPRPPRPREVLRFADEYAIPAAVAALEANVRALELLQAGIRASDPERAADEAGRAVRDRGSTIGRASLDRLDRALTELESAIEDSGMPGDREARDLLTDARRLNDEIRERVEAGGRPTTADVGRGDAIRIEVEAEGEADEGRDVDAEVESELETVREEVEAERGGTTGRDDEGTDDEPDA